MIHAIATIELKPGKRADYLEAFIANVPAVLQEEGCIEYTPTVDHDSGIHTQYKNENVVTVIEKWETIDNLKAHMDAGHMHKFREKTDPFVQGVTLTILENA